VACAAAAGLRWWSPGHSRRWSRLLGRLGLLAGVLFGAVGLLFVRAHPAVAAGSVSKKTDRVPQPH
jgi:hypothetical protein